MNGRFDKMSREDLIAEITRLEADAAQVENRKADEFRRMLNELRTHQSDLEMQNRELQALQGRFEEACNRYVYLYDYAPVGYLSLDGEGNIEELNIAAAEMLGRERSHLLGQSFADWVTDDDVPLLERHLQRAFDAGAKKVIDELSLEAGVERRSVRLESVVTREFTSSTPRCHSAMLDITRQKQAEAYSRQQLNERARIARLATMGEMASSIAHDLNQPLGTISLYCQTSLRMLQTGKFDPDKLTQALEQSYAQAQRAGEIIRRLRDFVRKGQSNKIDLDLNAIVQETATFVRADASEQHVDIQLDVEEDLPTVEADRVQIEQVLLNLMRNSIEAMQAARTENAQLQIRAIRVDYKAVQISISDNGPGLDAEASSAVLDPFYTTKPEGMGMGLAIGRTIVEAHGGRLWSEPRASGALFHFTLPLASR